MSARVCRWLLWITAVTAGYVGFWALCAPRLWQEAFPGFGLRWLPVLGPYNEHLSRDVGALYLALGALTAGAAVRAGDRYLVRLTGAVWLVFSVPHLVFHVVHLDVYGPLDRVLNVLGLGWFVLVGALLLSARRTAR
ncbi:MAG TPA: hypothetical protein VGH99_17870 [Pseudonocardia sp.]|jgi:hypothetical protein